MPRRPASSAASSKKNNAVNKSSTKPTPDKTVWQKLEQLDSKVEITVGIDFKLAACFQSVGNQVAMKASADPADVEQTAGILREAVEEIAGDLVADTKATVQVLTSIRDELE